MKNIILTYYLIYISLIASAQSFSKTYPELNNRGEVFLESENNSFVMLTGGVSDDIVLTKLNLDGSVVWSKNVEDRRIETISDFFETSIRNPNPFKILSNQDIVVTNVINELLDRNSFITYIDKNGNKKWSREIDHELASLGPPRVFQTDNETILLVSVFEFDDSSILSFTYFDLDGNLKEEKQLINYASTTTNSVLLFGIENDRIAIVRNEPLSSQISFYDADLNFIESITTNFKVYDLKKYKDQYYLIGNLVEPVNFFESNPNLVCLDSNFDPKWGYTFDIEHLFLSQSISFHNDHILYASLDLNCFHDKYLFFNIDGDLGPAYSSLHLGMLGTAASIINIGDKFLIRSTSSSPATFKVDEYRTLPDLIDEELDYYLPEVCVNTFDYAAQIIKNDREIYEPYNMNLVINNFDLIVENFEVSDVDIVLPYSDSGCPVPFFYVKDTFCINESILIDSLFNEDADEVSWILEGSDIISSDDYMPIPFSYSTPGNYLITQQINHEGCITDYALEVTIVSPITTNLTTDTLLCENTSHIIDANTENATAYLWEDNTNLPYLIALDSGKYNLTLSDKYCSQDIEFSVNYFDYSSFEFDLGDDTIICKQEPIQINIVENENVDYIWNDGVTTIQRQINRTGLYELQATLDGCQIKDEIFIQAEDCSTHIYLPSAFSPNLDGINDSFYPLGNFFEVIDFQIFDRWGNMMHGEPIAWSGDFRGQTCIPGVYFYILKVRNTLLNVEEHLSGNVMLMK